MNPKWARSGLVALCTAAGLTFQAAHADVVIQEKISVEGIGLMRMMNMSGTTTTSISGKRARMDTDMQMQNRMVRMFARGAGQTSEIIRLDEDKVYELNVKRKVYTETSLAEQRAELAKAMEQAQQAQAQQPSPTGMDESECEWTEPTVDVKKTGAKGTFAGYSAEQVLISTSQSCKDKKTGAVCELSLSLDQWIAPDFEGEKEALGFHEAYAKQMGLTAAGSRDFAQRAETLFGRYEGAWKQIAAKMRDVKGYPVKSTFAMSFGGPQCQQAQAASEESNDTGGNPAASAIGGIGGIAGEVGGRIAGSIFNRRKKEAADASAQQASAETVAANGMITPLRITSELVSISKAPIPASTFEVPAGFKKVESIN